MKRCLLVILLLFVFLQITTAQTGKVIGSVYDKSSGEALSHVNVMLFPLGVSANTEADGSYILIEIPEGTYRMVVAHKGYLEQSRKVLMHPGKTISSDFYLLPNIEKLDARANDTLIMKKVIMAILTYYRSGTYKIKED